ncbi:MAG: HNH endonuclease [Alphaproteobacteria bacterium]|nr:HNH endonuclease [Alphaproteobacteria bacterium]
MNDFGSVLLGNYEESAEYRNLALGSGAVKVAKDAASVGWSALKWTGRSTGEVIGAFLGMGSDRAIANGRAAGDFLPDIVVLVGTGGLSSAGRATVQGGVAIANGIEKAAVFTKNMVQTAGTMTRGGELAYAGAGVGSSTSKVGAAVRGAEMGNLAREGVSGVREAAAGISEKSVAKDMSPRVKNVESNSSPRVAQNGTNKVGQSVQKKLADRKVKPVESRASLSDELVQKPFDPFAMRHDLEAVYGAGSVKSTTLALEGSAGMKYAGQRNPVSNVVYDMRGNPMFDTTSAGIKYETILKLNDFQNKNRASHMRAATRQLRADIEAGRIPAYKFSEQQLKDIKSGKAQIDGFTWHHDQQARRMQLIEKKTHADTEHTGSVGIIKNGVKVK